MKKFTQFAVLALLVALPFQASSSAQGEPQVNLYNGSGINPTGFSSLYGPYVGEPWMSLTVITIPYPGEGDSGLMWWGDFPAPSILLAGLGGPAQPGWTPGGIFTGELLCPPPLVRLSSSPTGVHSVLIPADPGLIGARFCVQAAIPERSVSGQLTLRLQNALLLHVGVHAAH